jgi:hypothetical protein
MEMAMLKNHGDNMRSWDCDGNMMEIHGKTWFMMGFHHPTWDFLFKKIGISWDVTIQQMINDGL